jgi:hypothetical protein
MAGIPSTYPLPLIALESMIKSLASVIKILKPPKDRFSISWLLGTEQSRSKSLFRYLIGQSGVWTAQHDSDLQPTP